MYGNRSDFEHFWWQFIDGRSRRFEGNQPEIASIWGPYARKYVDFADTNAAHKVSNGSWKWSSDLVRAFAILLRMVPGTAVKGDPPRTQACTEQAPQRLAFATHLRGARLLSRPSAVAQACFDDQRWPSSSSGATFFSDTRKVSMQAEITLRPGELLVATLAVSIATQDRNLWRQIHLLPPPMHYGSEK